MSTWIQPTAAQRLEILQQTKSVAIVGASTNPARASYFVATYLLSSSPYRVYLINPRATEILGQSVYPTLEALPEVPDLVDVFRRHDDLPQVAQDAAEIGAQTLWIQLGSWNDEAAQIGTQSGLNVVMDRCLKIEHARFHGGLNLAGFNTGVISSRRQLT
ncbi:MAG TPA: CoA-binding protein [Actinomycetales bacterium]|nr:CoA-binding protein [Actinomycetales bacterium]